MCAEAGGDGGGRGKLRQRSAAVKENRAVRAALVQEPTVECSEAAFTLGGLLIQHPHIPSTSSHFTATGSILVAKTWLWRVNKESSCVIMFQYCVSAIHRLRSTHKLANRL